MKLAEIRIRNVSWPIILFWHKSYYTLFVLCIDFLYCFVTKDQFVRIPQFMRFLQIITPLPINSKDLNFLRMYFSSGPHEKVYKSLVQRTQGSGIQIKFSKIASDGWIGFRKKLIETSEVIHPGNFERNKYQGFLSDLSSCHVFQLIHTISKDFEKVKASEFAFPIPWHFHLKTKVLKKKQRNDRSNVVFVKEHLLLASLSNRYSTNFLTYRWNHIQVKMTVKWQVW